MANDREDDNYQALRRYLLAEPPGLDADETARLEERLLVDIDLFALSCAVEEELVESCARGEIPPERCASLISRLSASASGRERIAFLKDLGEFQPRPSQPLAFVRPEPAPQPTSDRTREQREREVRSRRFRVSRLAAGLAAATLATWIGIKIVPGHLQVPAEPVQVAVPLRQQTRGGTESGPIFTHRVPAGHPLKLKVSLEGPEDGAILCATLFRDGEEVGSAEVLTTHSETLIVTVPARLLDSGGYRLTVSRVQSGQGAGGLEIGTSEFKVVIQ